MLEVCERRRRTSATKLKFKASYKDFEKIYKNKENFTNIEKSARLQLVNFKSVDLMHPKVASIFCFSLLIKKNELNTKN